VVKFDPAIDARAEAQRRQLAVLRQLPYSENTFVLQANPSMISLDLLEICNRWAAGGEAIWAEPNLVSTTVPHAPNDRYLVQQLHHPIIDSQGAWDIVQAAEAAGEIADVVLAVNDYGCQTTHEDLVPILTSQFSFSTNTTVLLEHPHGTSTCGIAAAVLNNTKGVAGIAGFPGFVDMIVVQIPNSIPAGTEQDFAAMLLWCAGLPNGRAVPAALARGADVMSNSWGQHGIALSGDITAAFDALADTGRNDLGCVVVFAAGNHDDFFDEHFPWAAHPAVIAVSASTVTAPERKVGTSNFGDGIEVCAPGGENSAVAGGNESTFSTTSKAFDPLGDYDYFGETSAACPMVAGVAALMLAVNPDLDAEKVREILRTTAVKIDGGNKDPIGGYDNGYSGWYGYGRIDARAAVQAAQAARAEAAHVPAAPTNVRITN
jgi:subtilisin family serine protease